MGDYSMSAIEQEVRSVIEHELPRELSKLFDLDVETKVEATKEGSLIVFFSALIVAYPLIANYHDFYESVHLIKKHCASLLQSVADSKFGGSIDTSVCVYYPNVPDPTEYPFRWMRHMFGHPGGEEAFAAAAFMQRPATPHGRDLFFWYLVVMNIILMTLVGSLVYRSVSATYFDQPAKALIAPATSRTTAR
jgi:hypothetical protein